MPLNLAAEVSARADVHVVSYRRMLADIARVGVTGTPVALAGA